MFLQLSVEPVAQLCEGTSKSSNTSPKVKRKPDRPSEVSQREPLVVTIGGRQDVLLTTRDEFKRDGNMVRSPFKFLTSLCMNGMEKCPIQWIIYLF